MSNDPPKPGPGGDPPPDDPRQPIEIEPTSQLPPSSGSEPERKTDDEAEKGYGVDEAPAEPHHHDFGDEDCPNCGAPRSDRQALICLRCGYDLKTLKVVQTETGETTEEEEPTKRRRLSIAGRGDYRLPGAMAAVAGLILVIGYLAGFPGLLPGVEAVAVDGGEAAIEFPDRLMGILDLAPLSGVLVGCGLLGLLMLSQLLDAQAGDLGLAAIRLVGIVVVMRLVTWIDLSSRTFEWTVEAALQIAVFLGLSILLFSFKPREGLNYGLATLLSFITIWLLSLTVAWVTSMG